MLVNLKRWLDRRFRGDVGRSVRLWVAYLGLVSIGVVFSSVLLLGHTEQRLQAQAEAHSDERARLISIIEERLPAITQQAESAALISKDAASGAKAAVDAAAQSVRQSNEALSKDSR